MPSSAYRTIAITTTWYPIDTNDGSYGRVTAQILCCRVDREITSILWLVATNTPMSNLCTSHGFVINRCVCVCLWSLCVTNGKDYLIVLRVMYNVSPGGLLKTDSKEISSELIGVIWRLINIRIHEKKKELEILIITL